MPDAKEARTNVTIASYTVNSLDESRRSWDLTPYQGAGMGTPGGTWRIKESGYNLQYFSGCDASILSQVPASWGGTAQQQP